jgi:hypothetical protein
MRQRSERDGMPAWRRWWLCSVQWLGGGVFGGGQGRWLQFRQITPDNLRLSELILAREQTPLR